MELNEADQPVPAGARAPLKPPFHREEVNGVTIAPITNAGKQPHSNPEWMQKFQTLRDQLKQVL